MSGRIWICIALGGLLVQPASATGIRTLRVGLSSDGTTFTAYAKALDRAVLRPLAAKAGLHVRIVKLTSKPAWDLAQLDAVALADACASGRVRRLDWAALGGRARLLHSAASDCGAGAAIEATVLTWDAAKVPGTPGWSDFWNVARFPGRRGLYRGPMGTLEIALMADGVAPRDVYTVLRSKDGPDRAFRKLDQLRPYIVWWRNAAEAVDMVVRGAAVMNSAPNAAVVAAAGRLHRMFGVQWSGSLAMVRSWTVLATTGLGPEALRVIAASMEPSAQTALLAGSGLGALTAAAPQPDDRSSPRAHLDQAVMIDGGFWHDNGATLKARFETWLLH